MKTSKKILLAFCLIQNVIAAWDFDTPRFEQDEYEIMIPGGKNKQTSEIAVFLFFGENKDDVDFMIEGDSNDWFEIGKVSTKTVQQGQVSTVPLLLKENIVVEDSTLEDDKYSFFVLAIKGENITQSSVVAEVIPVQSKMEKENENLTVEGSGEGEYDEDAGSANSTNTSEEVVSIQELVNELQQEALISTTPSDIAVEQLVHDLQNEVLAAARTQETPSSAGVPMSSIKILFLDAEQKPTNAVTLPQSTDNGDAIIGYEIRIELDPQAQSELVKVSVEPSDIFDVIPHYILANMPTHLVVKNADLLDNMTSAAVTIKAEYAEIASDTEAEANVEITMEPRSQGPIFPQQKYVFHVPENSATGTNIGSFGLSDQNSSLIYSVIGAGSGLFLFDNGNVNLLCPSEDPCLDFESQKAYYLVVIATTTEGVSSTPVTVEIVVDDANDNAPTLSIPDKSIKITDGRLAEAFKLHIKDTDSEKVNHNEITFAGSAAAFLQPEKATPSIFKFILSNSPEIGGYILDVTVHDTSNLELQESTYSIKVEVDSTPGHTKFVKAKYETTKKIDDLVPGYQIVQLQFSDKNVENNQFLMLEDNAGWLTVEDFTGKIRVAEVPSNELTPGSYHAIVAMVNRQTSKIIDRCEVIINVEGIQKSKSVFSNRLFTIDVEQKHIPKKVQFSPLIADNAASFVIAKDSIYAWSEDLQSLKLPSSAVDIDFGKVTIDELVLRQLRGIQFELVSSQNENDRALTTLRIIGDSKAEAKKRLAKSKPKFIAPFVSEENVIDVKLPEEAPLGYAFLHLPAVDPMTGKVNDNVTLAGRDANLFVYHEGSLATNQHIDHETLGVLNEPLEVQVIAHHPGGDTTANLHVSIENVNDNAPVILDSKGNPFELSQVIQISKNAIPGDAILEFTVKDVDGFGPDSIVTELQGPSAGNFALANTNDSWSIILSENAEINPELQHLLLVARDTADNSNQLPIFISGRDKKHDGIQIQNYSPTLKIVKTWPTNTIVGFVTANGKYKNKNAMTYEIEQENPKFLSINNNGEIYINEIFDQLEDKGVYNFVVKVSSTNLDALPVSVNMTANVVDAATVSQDPENNLAFIYPPADFIYSITENTSSLTNLLRAQAENTGLNADSRKQLIHYTLSPLSSADDGWLAINASTGDVFTVNKLDYEAQNFITVKLTAYNAQNQSTSRWLRIRVLDSNDNEPYFLQKTHDHGVLTFVYDDTEVKSGSNRVIVGSLQAADLDSFNEDSTYYYLLPQCNNNVEIDQKSGEVRALLDRSQDSSLNVKHSCALASSNANLTFDVLQNVKYDASNSSMTDFIVHPLSNIMPTEAMQNNAKQRIISIDSALNSNKISFSVNNEQKATSQYLYKLQDVQFKPFDSDEPEKSTVEVFVDPDTGDIRMDPEIVSAPEGAYSVDVVEIQRKNGKRANELVTHFHRVNSENRLRFVFNNTADETAQLLESFTSKLTDIVNAQNGNITVITSCPAALSQDMRMIRSYSCFHLSRDGQIVPQEEASAILSPDHERIAALFTSYKVIKVDPCNLTSSVNRSTRLSKGLVLGILGIVTAFLILFALISYTCFVTRYRQVMDRSRVEYAQSTYGQPVYAAPQYLNIHY